MAETRKHLFKKGVSGNPKGKPKGAVMASTRNFSKIKALAAEKYEEAFNLLWKNIELGEGWAYQLYFKELLPKRIHQKTVLIKPEEGENRLDAITKALPEFNELTHEEVMHEVKVFNNIELAKVKDQGENILSVMSDEQIEAISDMYNKAKKKE